MENISPAKLLQINGIEISPCERRTTEQVVADLIAAGLIETVIDSVTEPHKSTL